MSDSVTLTIVRVASFSVSLILNRGLKLAETQEDLAMMVIEIPCQHTKFSLLCEIILFRLLEMTASQSVAFAFRRVTQVVSKALSVADDAGYILQDQI